MHTAEWPREHADRCEFLVKMGVSLDGITCICHACNTAILRGTRLLMDDKLPQQYKPRWHKKYASLGCCIPDCTGKARVINHPYSGDVICEHFGSALPQQQHSDKLPLCMAHYLQLGRHNKPESGSDVACKVCGIKRPHKQTQSRRFVACPEPTLIESYLRESADFDSSLNESDMVCYSCYKYCKRILDSRDCTLSSEDVIKELTCKQSCVQSYLHDHIPDCLDSGIEVALNKTVVYLCQCLLPDQAVLFPTLYKQFLSYLPESIECPSKARLLTYIGNEFGDLISSVCHHRKIGRIFFRTKSDPYVLLSHALASQHSPQCNAQSINQGSNCVAACGDQVNKQVHHVASYMLGQAYKDDRLILGLDVDRFVQQVCVVSPKLW